MSNFECLESRVLFHAGDYDPAFQGGVPALTSFSTKNGAVASAVTVLADGGILAGGSLQVHDSNGATVGMQLVAAKYHFDGSLDNSFGAGGEIVATPRGMTGVNKIVQAADGGYLFFGGANGAPMILKFTPAGKVDTTFGKNGLLQLDTLSPRSVTVDPSGRILVTGLDHNTGVVRRFAPNGKVDTTFATNGDFRIEPGADPAVDQFHQVQVGALALDNRGNIFITGTDTIFEQIPEETPHVVSRTDFIRRLDESGQFSESLESKGLTMLVSNEGDFSIVRVLPDLGIVLRGATKLAQLHYDGSINTKYGTNGVSQIYVGTGTVGVADDGSAVVPFDPVDDQLPGISADFSIRQILANGKLDSTFGTNGEKVIETSTQPFGINAQIAFAPDGTAVAVGQEGQLSPSGKVDTRRFAVARVFTGKGPAMQLIPRTLKTSSRYLSMSVLIRDDGAVDTSTLDNDDLKLFDSNLHSRRIRFLASEDVNGDGKYIRATYRIIGPGSFSWTSNANGSYEVRLQRKQVFDTDGNTAAAQVLGTVRVKIA